MTFVTPELVIAGGITVLTLLVLQIFIGLRKIKFKGAMHIKVHRGVAYTMLGVALAHAFSALVLFGYIRL